MSRRQIDRQELAVLRAVRGGAEGANAVASATDLSVSTVVHIARGLVRAGLLCALDGEPWAVRAEALPLLEAP